MPLWVGYCVESNHCDQDLYGYLLTILPESHRWHTLVIDINDDHDDEYDFDSDLKHLNASRFALLSRLLVVDHAGSRGVSLPNYFKLGCPALKYVQADTLSLQWDSYQLSDLEEFSLSQIPSQTAPSISQIIDILKMSPSLLTLELSNTHISVPSQADVSNPIPSPPVLDSLQLNEIEPSGAIRLLHPHVKLHNNSNLGLCSDDDETGGSHDLVETEEAILAYASQHLSSVSSCPAVLEIRLLSHGSFEFNYGNFACDISLGANKITTTIKRIERLVLSLNREQRSKPMVLSLNLERSRMCRLMHILTPHLNVAELRVDSVVNQVVHLNHPDSTTGEWAFANMTRFALHLGFLGIGDFAQTRPKLFAAFLKLAEARSGLTRGAEEVDKKLPVALETIELLGTGKIQMQDIRRLEALVSDVRICPLLGVIGRPLPSGTVDL